MPRAKGFSIIMAGVAAEAEVIDLDVKPRGKAFGFVGGYMSSLDGIGRMTDNRIFVHNHISFAKVGMRQGRAP